MNQKLLHTPEGVRDIYADELARMKNTQEALDQVIHSFGYCSIQTPSLEFFDIFAGGIGTTKSREIYKLEDREGNTMVLRPDITPSVARAAAKYFTEEDKVIRLTYQGNVFKNNKNHQGRLKESTQVGAELIGENSVDADAEILALVSQCIEECEISDYIIAVGHVDVFRGLTEAAGFNEEEQEKISALVSNKNIYGIRQFLAEKNLDEELVSLFDLVSLRFNNPGEWEKYEEAAEKYPLVSNALDTLKQIYEVLSVYGYDAKICVEPGLIRSYDYYTGIIFAGYTYGSGEPVVSGGRYDHLLSYFGKDAAAIGFAFSVDALIKAAEKQGASLPKEPQKTVIVYHESQRVNAIHMAQELRKAGQIIELVVRDNNEPLNVAAYEDGSVRITTLA